MSKSMNYVQLICLNRGFLQFIENWTWQSYQFCFLFLGSFLYALHLGPIRLGRGKP